MIRIALTGSIGMGKSTTAQMFANRGIPVWDADAAVHRLYAPDAAGSQAISLLVPNAVGAEGVDRARVRQAILEDPALLRQIEGAVHPLVAEDRGVFLDDEDRKGTPVALCDIPLLFEIGGAQEFDHVVVVTASAEIQRERVLGRPGMTEAAFAAILAKQVPDAEKRARADFVIDTSEGLEAADQAVGAILKAIGVADA